VTVRASLDQDCMLAAWLVGTEHQDEHDAGEVCIFEIDANAISDTTTARCGIKAHGDSRYHGHGRRHPAVQRVEAAHVDSDLGGRSETPPLRALSLADEDDPPSRSRWFARTPCHESGRRRPATITILDMLSTST
jgi:hypothetical protein